MAVEKYLLVISSSKLSATNPASNLETPLEINLDNPPVGLRVLKGHNSTISALISPPSGVPYLATPSVDGFVSQVDSFSCGVGLISSCISFLGAFPGSNLEHF